MKKTIAALVIATIPFVGVTPANAVDKDISPRECRGAYDNLNRFERAACEDNGWTIRKPYAINPNDVVRRMEFDECFDTEEYRDTNCYDLEDLEVRHCAWGSHENCHRIVWYVDGFRF